MLCCSRPLPGGGPRPEGSGPWRVSQGLSLSSLFLFGLPSAHGAPLAVAPDQGLDLFQIDLTYAGAPQADSQYGLAVVDVSEMQTDTGFAGSTGFLNIETPQGWVVQNLPVDQNMVSAGTPGLSVMFDLGLTPGDATNLSATAVLSQAPETAFAVPPPRNRHSGRVWE